MRRKRCLRLKSLFSTRFETAWITLPLVASLFCRPLRAEHSLYGAGPGGEFCQAGPELRSRFPPHIPGIFNPQAALQRFEEVRVSCRHPCQEQSHQDSARLARRNAATLLLPLRVCRNRRQATAQRPIPRGPESCSVCWETPSLQTRVSRTERGERERAPRESTQDHLVDGHALKALQAPRGAAFAREISSSL